MQSATPLPPSTRRPICVDLDGTLIETDMLVESLLVACRSWTILRSLPGLLLRGKAALKAGLAKACPIAYERLPYDAVLIDFLRKQKEAGAKLLLVTATNEAVALRINEYLGFLFDEVLASGEHLNLRGNNKAKILVERFGDRGFTYIGNDVADLRVWRRAGGALIVGAPAALVRRARKIVSVEHVFGHRGLNRAPWALLSAGLAALAFSGAKHVFMRNVASGAGKSSQ